MHRLRMQLTEIKGQFGHYITKQKQAKTPRLLLKIANTSYQYQYFKTDHLVFLKTLSNFLSKIII